eukprot:1603591-Pyramimonas_sp.AAC.4
MLDSALRDQAIAGERMPSARGEDIIRQVVSAACDQQQHQDLSQVLHAQMAALRERAHQSAQHPACQVRARRNHEMPKSELPVAKHCGRPSVRRGERCLTCDQFNTSAVQLHKKGFLALLT